MPRLLSLATVVPDHGLHQDDVLPAAAAVFGDAFGDFSRLESIYANTQIETCYSCVPLEWYAESHSFAERNQLYIESALDLLERATLACLEKASLDIADIGGIVTVSSTGITTPTLDALLMERLAMRRDMRRLPIFGLGCVGGVLGLARTAAQAQAEPARHFLFLVVELCGLTFRNQDRSKSNVVATALFGDGAAAAIISCEGDGPRLSGWGEHTWPDSLDIMGWKVSDDGLSVIFSRHIPNLVRANMREAAVSFLTEQGLTLADIDRFVCHPGGAKVIDALEEVFDVEPGGLHHTRRVLRKFGNMSAATILFVLDDVLGEGGAKRCLLSSLGPGFTAGFLTLETA